ncbi:MAG TPA: ROK family protein [Actinomycetota bacterium]|nr:ROK family protein [Actinomycetota bacterium]
MTDPHAVGVDIGGTKASAVRTAADGAVVARARAATPADDVPALLDAVLDVARAVLEPSVAAIGVGAAGLVEAATGRVRYAPNIAWREVDLVAAVELLGVPVVVDNDCTMAAIGEHRIGAGKGHDDLLYVGVGTGIGGGIVSGGRVQRGAHGFAGEIGHIVVEPDGVRCGCGARGCWETVASGSAISRLGRERLAPTADGPAVVAAALRGEEVAREILAEVGTRLGTGIAGLVNVLDPELVIVGGGAAAGAGDLLLEPARGAFAATVEGGGHRPQVPLVSAALGDEGAAIGAALRALEGVA